MKVLFVWPNKDAFGYKPLSLALLSAQAKDAGWQTALFDTTPIDFGYKDNTQAGEEALVYKPVDLTRYGHVKERIDLEKSFSSVFQEFKPDCLAVSALSDEFLIARSISKVAKRINPHVPVIWGGKYATLNPKETLLSGNADFVCVGEGLDAFPRFLKVLSDSDDPYAIPNICAKVRGKIIRNPIAPLRAELDTLPAVDWEIFDKRHFYKPFDGSVYRAGDHMLNWGCPYHCTYCINHVYHSLYDKKYFMRRYSVPRIISELRALKERYRLEFFKFHDEDFLMRPFESLVELSAAYKEEVGLPFVIETNAKSVTKEKVDLLKDMNCVSASIAIETGDARLRKRVLARVDSQKDICNAFAAFNSAGIRTCSFNMLGIPYESRATYEKTVTLNRHARVHYPDIGFFYPFEGTTLKKLSVEKGFFKPLCKRTGVYKRNTPALSFSSLTARELVSMLKVFVLYVKLPLRYKPFIARSETLDPLGKRLRLILVKIYYETVFRNNGWYASSPEERRYYRKLKKIVSQEPKKRVRNKVKSHGKK